MVVATTTAEYTAVPLHEYAPLAMSADAAPYSKLSGSSLSTVMLPGDVKAMRCDTG